MTSLSDQLIDIINNNTQIDVSILENLAIEEFKNPSIPPLMRSCGMLTLSKEDEDFVHQEVRRFKIFWIERSSGGTWIMYNSSLGVVYFQIDVDRVYVNTKKTFC
jgi:hypothetical protein